MKIFSKTKTLYTGICLLLAGMFTSSCETGLVYEDVPEDYYSDVSLTNTQIISRYLFENCLYAKNFGEYTTYIAQTTHGQSGVTWTNETGSNFTLPNGTVVTPGETITLTGGHNKIVERADNNAPDGKVYTLYFYVPSKVVYSSPNKGYLYDLSKLPSGFTLVGGENGMSEKVQTGVDLTQLVVTLQSQQHYGDDCKVEPQNGAPKLGAPGDYTEPRQYLLLNNLRRPEGVPQAKRLYEVHVVVLP